MPRVFNYHVFTKDPAHDRYLIGNFKSMDEIVTFFKDNGIKIGKRTIESIIYDRIPAGSRAKFINIKRSEVEVKKKGSCYVSNTVPQQPLPKLKISLKDSPGNQKRTLGCVKIESLDDGMQDIDM